MYKDAVVAYFESVSLYFLENDKNMDETQVMRDFRFSW